MSNDEDRIFRAAFVVLLAVFVLVALASVFLAFAVDPINCEPDTQSWPCDE